MRFLVDDDNWDIIGYKEYFKSIIHLFDNITSEFILTNSFHDGTIKHLELINHVDEEIEDPTSIRMMVRHYDESFYEIIWSKVRRFYFDYDITRSVYTNSNEIVSNSMCGINEWGYDEILETEDHMLSHEIVLCSKTRIIIICKEIQINPV
ncbi:hypothetical protein IMZ08_18770 [Bacillus luteolus]|uniref:Uncharacterized protein n=1 Tax=Litchfieldia luteola TaxID=682179 RepID=A0ABR9QNJ8_9BACI|nr:hypothetical protein [Cytobacillus luteolus]MBE4910083.1 hypothetical protein [Cytobacillus luteolus]MBP1942353.1 hypothetical protein [Cytobacillus luteolus]